MSPGPSTSVNVIEISKYLSGPAGWLIDHQGEVHIIFEKKTHNFVQSAKYRHLIKIEPMQFLFHRLANELLAFFWKRSVEDHHPCSGVTNSLVLSMYGPCSGFFIDRHERWYCSLEGRHQVIRYSFVFYTGRSETLLGAGAAGSSQKSLDRPTAIYVDDHNFDVYIADTGNHRVQLCKDGQAEGSTLVGEPGKIKFKLRHPTGLSMDQEGLFYILEFDNARILRCSSSNCHEIIRFAQPSSEAQDQLRYPSHLAFDSHGNLLVLDHGNRRVQRFNVARNSCCKYSQHCSTDCRRR